LLYSYQKSSLESSQVVFVAFERRRRRRRRRKRRTSGSHRRPQVVVVLMCVGSHQIGTTPIPVYLNHSIIS